MREANELGIGPMGFGGETTVLGVKARGMHRLPASFFVSVSYMCWAHRRRRMQVDGETSAIRSERSMIELTLPLSDAAVRELHVGDPVSLHGVMVTGRDAAHKCMVETFVRKSRPRRPTTDRPLRRSRRCWTAA